MTTIFRTTALLCGIFLLSSPAVSQEGWSDRLSINGSLRLRYEGIDEEFVPNRDRARYRARLGLTAVVYDDVKVVFSLASGADSPTSRNVTFGDGFATDDFGFELAYVDWKINDTLEFHGGKIKNPLYRAGSAQLIWDNDVNPEGFALLFDNGNFFGSANLFLVEERSAADDTHVYAAQAGMKFAAGDAGKITAGIGYLGYTNTVGNLPFYNGRALGNTVDGNGNYVNDYRNAEIFGAYDMKLGDLPLQIFAHFTRNSEASTEDTAYAFGAKIGSAKAQGTWQSVYTYMDVEADAVVGSFSDSNFGGGGTDASGHILRAKYMVRDRISLGGSLFINEMDRFQGIEHDYSRIQLDVEFKFQ